MMMITTVWSDIFSDVSLSVIVHVKALRENYSGNAWEHYTSFSFDSDWLVFHPQFAEDCGWSAKTMGYYKVQI